MHQIASIRLGRRAMSIAVFHNAQLEYARLRHLPSAAQSACDSASGYLSWAIAQFHPEIVAIEEPQPFSKSRRARITARLIEIANKAGVPTWPVAKPELLGSYAEPQPATQKELCTIAAAIWPTLAAKGQGVLNLQATALGLFVVAQRLLREMAASSA